MIEISICNKTFFFGFFKVCICPRIISHCFIAKSTTVIIIIAVIGNSFGKIIYSLFVISQKSMACSAKVIRLVVRIIFDFFGCELNGFVKIICSLGIITE